MLQRQTKILTMKIDFDSLHNFDIQEFYVTREWENFNNVKLCLVSFTLSSATKALNIKFPIASRNASTVSTVTKPAQSVHSIQSVQQCSVVGTVNTFSTLNEVSTIRLGD